MMGYNTAGQRSRQHFSGYPVWITAVAVVCCFLSGCVSAQKGVSRDLFSELTPGVNAAVSYIPEAATGDITGLGNLWRDRIEKILSDRGVVIRARKDMVALIDDMETFGAGRGEQTLWENADADVVVCGNYTILMPQAAKDPHKIRVVAKAYDVRDARLISAQEFVENLDASWVALAAKIYGNVHQEKLAVVSPEKSAAGKYRLTAGLNRKNNCYAPGQSAKIHIETEPGHHVYIFNLTADNNISLLYPNRWLPDQPLDTGRLVFPPSGSHVTDLLLYPLADGRTCKESFKIISSPDRLDFSFLPVPENQVFAGANGKDIDRVTRILQTHGDYSETSLTYYVGTDCQ
jgi:hypothetical protein